MYSSSCFPVHVMFSCRTCSDTVGCSSGMIVSLTELSDPLTCFLQLLIWYSQYNTEIVRELKALKLKQPMMSRTVLNIFVWFCKNHFLQINCINSELLRYGCITQDVQQFIYLTQGSHKLGSKKNSQTFPGYF